jgi:hypothetical protein
MKVLRVVGLALVLSVCLVAWLGISNVEAMEYLGDYCYRVEGDTEADDNMFDMRLAVVHIGNDHYSLYGKMVLNSASEIFDGVEVAVHGNAEISSDGKIISTIVGAAKNDNNNHMAGLIVSMKFDNISHGRFQWIGPAKEGEIDIVYEEGDITKIPCQ